MPAWIHNRAEHLLAKNPDMEKGTAFAIATQQGHKLGKNPKGYGTKQGKRTAKRKFDKPRKEYVKTPNPKGLESPKMAAVKSDYILDQVGLPKVRPRRADAPDPKHRVKLGMQVPGVFGMPQQGGQQAAGMNPAGQLAQSQKVGVPKLPAPKMQTMGMKMAFAVSQYSGVRGPGKLDYTPSDMKYAGPPGERGTKRKSCGATKMAAMADELAKLNGVAMTPKGKLRQSQMVGAPKVTAPPGPSISELSKPVGFGTKAPGAVKGTI